ncbi:MAG: hypothetical protein J5527_03550 [Treponema sp.]|nr:hypothetical protein [Treponema sp.]
MKKSILVLGVLVSLVMLVGCAKEPDSFVVTEKYDLVSTSGANVKSIWPKNSNGEDIYYYYKLTDAKGKYKKYNGYEIFYNHRPYMYSPKIANMFHSQCLSIVEEMISDNKFTIKNFNGNNIIVLNYHPYIFNNSDVTIAIEDLYDYVQIITQNSWLPGEQNQVYNYQAEPEISAGFGYAFPVVGNKVHLTWHAVSNVDISKLYCRLVDVSAETGGWMELNKAKQNLNDFDPFLKDTTYIMKENIKAGEAFDVDFTLPVEVKPLAQVNLCIWYNVSDANPEGPAVISSVIK